MKNFKRAKSKYIKGFELIEFENVKGENVVVELRTATATDSKNDVMRLWVKAGKVEKFIKNRIVVDTYVTDKFGYCHRHYDPTIEIAPGGGRLNVKHSWILEDTEENRQTILDEIIRLSDWMGEYKNNLKNEVIG